MPVQYAEISLVQLAGNRMPTSASLVVAAKDSYVES